MKYYGNCYASDADTFICVCRPPSVSLKLPPLPLPIDSVDIDALIFLGELTSFLSVIELGMAYELLCCVILDFVGDKGFIGCGGFMFLRLD